MDTKALRQKILDLAIRGKLVSQSPNDEPASVLLERIHEQKKQMVKDGKLKPKDIKNDTIIFKDDDNLHYEKFQDGTVKCIEDQIPFDVPEGWCWTRLNDLALYKKGPFGSSLTKAMFVPESNNAIKVYEQKNAINKSAHLGHYFISQEKYEELKGFEIFPGDIIVSCAGTIGETFVMPSDMRKGIINQALMKIHLLDNSIKPFYLMYFDNKLKSLANEQGYGMALKNIPPFSVLKQYLIPIPPKAEQKKILERIKIILSNINEIDLYREKLQNDIVNVKSKILDLAIHGKLVPQDPNDEPVSSLLERIRTEKEELIKQGKIKRNKKESVIFKGDDNSYYEKLGNDVICIDDEIPFEIPNNWTWARISTIADITMGASPKSQDICNDTQYVEFHQGKRCFSKKVLMKSNQYTRKVTKIAAKQSVLLCVRAPVGELNITDRDICIGRGLASIRPLGNINEEFMFYWLHSYKTYLVNQATGSTFSAISSDTVRNIIIPIPPQIEQKRILNKIQKVFSLFGKLEPNS